MIKSELMTLWNVKSWTVETAWRLLCSPSISGRWSHNHEDHTIETQVKIL